MVAIRRDLPLPTLDTPRVFRQNPGMISKSTIFVALVAVGAALLIVVTVSTINQTDADGQPVGSGWSLR